MRYHRVFVASFVIVAMMLALASNSSAESRTVGAGDEFEKTLSADVGDIVSVSWWTIPSESLHFTVEDPSGVTVYEINSSTGAYSPGFADEGDYVFTWENLGTGSVQLEYSFFGFQELEEAWGTFILVAVIGTIVVIAIVVLLVVLLLMKGKKKAPQAPAAPVGPPVMDGKCTRCGSPVEPGVAFCPKCGAPLR